MKIENEIKLDFSDVLILPKRSESPSRKNVDLNRKFTFKNSGVTWEGVPVVAANMSTVGTFEMAKTLSKFGMMVCLHKYYEVEKLIEFFKENKAFYTLGIKEYDFEKLKLFTKKLHKPKYICLDVANGYTKFFVEKCKKLRDEYKDSVIMAGNVCTSEMVNELILMGGVDIVKVGIGGGSVCTTRIMTGIGVPQLSAIIECADAAHGLRGHVISDGGCISPGDVSKAFGAGADFVMLGGMLAGHEECEGEWENDPQSGAKKFLKFYGMSSEEAMIKFNGIKENYKASEGRCVKVKYKGKVENTIQEILGGIRSTCTYVGTEKLKDLSKCTTFIRVNNTHNKIFENNHVN